MYVGCPECLLPIDSPQKYFTPLLVSIDPLPIPRTGNKGKKSNGRDEVGDDIDDAMSSVSIDTYGSSLDYEVNNGGGSAYDSRGGEAGGGEEGSGSKSVDDFKEGVEMLTEKR